MSQKLEKVAKMKRKEIAATIERLNTAYEKRDKFQAEIIAVEKSDNQERSDFTKQMMILNKELEQAFMDDISAKRRVVVRDGVNINRSVSPTPSESTTHSSGPSVDTRSKKTKTKQILTAIRGGHSDSDRGRDKELSPIECGAQQVLLFPYVLLS